MMQVNTRAGKTLDRLGFLFKKLLSYHTDKGPKLKQSNLDYAKKKGMSSQVVAERQAAVDSILLDDTITYCSKQTNEKVSMRYLEFVRLRDEAHNNMWINKASHPHFWPRANAIAKPVPVPVTEPLVPTEVRTSPPATKRAPKNHFGLGMIERVVKTFDILVPTEITDAKQLFEL